MNLFKNIELSISIYSLDLKAYLSFLLVIVMHIHPIMQQSKTAAVIPVANKVGELFCICWSSPVFGGEAYLNCESLGMVIFTVKVYWVELAGKTTPICSPVITKILTFP